MAGKLGWWVIGILVLGGLASRGGPSPTPPATSTPTAIQKVATPGFPVEAPVPPLVNSWAPPSNPPTQPKQEPTKPVQQKVAWVKGNDIALRSQPAAKARIVDRLKKGRQIDVLDDGGEWTNVRDPVSQKVGWVASRLLSATPSTSAPPAAQRAPEPPPEKVKPRLSDSTIIAAIIQESRESYSGSCACPEDRDRAGRRCGKRSAYSKPGGYSPICYSSDVSRDMIEEYRRSN